jgi:DNA repair exonuclease SbcCD nuclease subunit
MIILNDLHLSVARRGGVTPSSQEALRTYIFEQFNTLLEKANGHDLCLLGDIFDDFEVSPRDWLQAYFMLEAWCRKNSSHKCILVAGNHDISAKGNKVSSFETLTSVLVPQHGNVCVVGIDDVHLYEGHIWIVAHHRNQDVFELHLNKVLEAVQPGDFVLLHANYHNKWAEQADHSLNVSEDVALRFTEKGVNLVFAHEQGVRLVVRAGVRGDANVERGQGVLHAAACSMTIGSQPIPVGVHSPWVRARSQ